jgi:hypothetical protein
VEGLHSGGWLLAVVHDGRRIAARYFDYTLREAKARFLADVRAQSAAAAEGEFWDEYTSA